MDPTGSVVQVIHQAVADVPRDNGGIIMDDAELYDLTNEIGDVEVVTTDQRIMLMQVQAIIAFAYQVNRLGALIEDLIEPGPSRWQRVKAWMHVKGWLR